MYRPISTAPKGRKFLSCKIKGFEDGEIDYTLPVVTQRGSTGGFVTVIGYEGERFIQIVVETFPTHWCELPIPLKGNVEELKGGAK